MSGVGKVFGGWISGLFSTPAPAPVPNGTVVANPSSPAPTPGPVGIPEPMGQGTLNGLDIYHEDGVTSWSELVSGGMSFVAAKATEGLTFTDSAYAANRKSAKLAGLIFGAYHFIHLDQDPVAQADFFAKTVQAAGGIDPTDFVMLDWETTSGDPYSASKDPGTIQAFLNEVKAKLGRRCVVYVGHSMVDAVGNPKFLAEYPFWLAEYSSKAIVPAPWTNWNFWQNSDSAKIPGLGNAGDSDLFRGNLQDLQALIKYTVL